MGKRVLLVDDSPFMRKLLKNILVPKGFEIVGEAGNGVEAIENYKKLKPDLVTMDIVMPTMGGIDALRNIKEVDPNANVIMCTAIGQQDMVVNALKTGAKGYIVKPFQSQKVLDEIQRVLG